MHQNFCLSKSKSHAKKKKTKTKKKEKKKKTKKKRKKNKTKQKQTRIILSTFLQKGFFLFRIQFKLIIFMMYQKHASFSVGLPSLLLA